MISMSIKNFSLGVMFMRKLVPGISIPQCKFIIDEKTGLHISIQVSAPVGKIESM